MNIIADESGTNAFYLDFRVHAVTKTEYDYSDKPTQKLIRATPQKGAFQYATDAASALNKYEATGAANIVIMSIINGGVDTTTGMSHATATFRTYVEGVRRWLRISAKSRSSSEMTRAVDGRLNRRERIPEQFLTRPRRRCPASWQTFPRSHGWRRLACRAMDLAAW
jgi:hypothetical protein